MSTSSAEKRIEALEDRHGVQDLVTIIRIIHLVPMRARGDPTPHSAIRRLVVEGRTFDRCEGELDHDFAGRAFVGCAPGVIALGF